MRVARRAPSGISVEALCRRGFVGLLDGLTTAAAMAPGETLEAYVEHRIRGAMLDFMRSANPAFAAARAASRDLARLLRRLRDEGSPHAGADELASGLGLDATAYADLLTRIAEAGLARIDVIDLEEGPQQDPSGEEPRACRRTLANAIVQLPLRERNLLGLLFEEELSIEEASAVLGCTSRAVTCLLTQTIHRLRADIGKE